MMKMPEWLLRGFALLLVLLGVPLSLALSGEVIAAETPRSVKQSQGVAGADLVVFNRQVFEFRTTFLGVLPAARADRALSNIEDALARTGDHTVSVKSIEQGKSVAIDDRMAFVVTPGDVDPLGHETLEQIAGRAAERLEQAISETRELRSVDAMIRALIASSIATAVYAVLLWAFAWLYRRAQRVVVVLAARKASSLKIGGAAIFDGEHVFPLMRRLLQAMHWLLVALISYQWLSFVLSRFPYTRAWGEHLNGYLFWLFGSLIEGTVEAIPGLGVAVAIFVVARFFISLLNGFFQRLAAGDEPLGWLDTDTMPTTRRLVSIAVWLFALAMAYPYLPGAHTDAFKGLSVLIGLMVSLGATSIVGQGAAGLILTYSRTIKVGEYVRVGDHEGTVTELGLFTTRVRTGLGEELTLPNSMIAGAVTKNYSRAVHGRGYIIDTVVTIGYDTPWRQVEAMLVEAARRTQGILADPHPRVFQTALSDFYPEYRLVAQAIPEQPRPRAEVLNMLHANIQDVFNEYGVQIMSPHYMTDPRAAKVVPQEQWHLPPAKQPEA